MKIKTNVTLIGAMLLLCMYSNAQSQTCLLYTSITMTDLAGMMYDSIHKKLFPLANHVIVYPAHGPGSSCGKNLGPNTYSTIGEEKQFNYAMKAETKEDFIKQVIDCLLYTSRCV